MCSQSALCQVFICLNFIHIKKTGNIMFTKYINMCLINLKGTTRCSSHALPCVEHQQSVVQRQVLRVLTGIFHCSYIEYNVGSLQVAGLVCDRCMVTMV